jgi:cell division protein FtsQ
MKRRARRIALAAAAAVAVSSPFWGPPLLRVAPGFETRRVEVSGTRLLAPHEVLAASGVRIGGSVWTDPAGWEAALRRHPVVAEAEVTRRLPNTLRIRVTEKRPAALVQAGTLRPVTAEGEVLPVDPARVPLDLPLVRAPVKPDARGRIPAGPVRALLAEAGRLGELDPALMARVSEVRPDASGALRLVLSAPAAEVLLPAGADDARLVRLRAALADLERRIPADSSQRRIRVDARWEDQIVVRLPAQKPEVR